MVPLPKALVFDVFDTVVDWRSTIVREGGELGRRHRRVVERTLSWLAKYRRLTVRYERRDDIHKAFLYLSCSLICFNHLSREY